MSSSLLGGAFRTAAHLVLGTFHPTFLGDPGEKLLAFFSKGGFAAHPADFCHFVGEEVLGTEVIRLRWRKFFPHGPKGYCKRSEKRTGKIGNVLTATGRVSINGVLPLAVFFIHEKQAAQRETENGQ